MTEENKKRKIKLRLELDELQNKQDKLNSFLGSKAYSRLSDVSQVLLIVQEKAMETYMTCLYERIIHIKS